MQRNQVVIDRSAFAQFLSALSRFDELTRPLQPKPNGRKNFAPTGHLTAREIEVLEGVRAGKTNKEIAALLGGKITERTIKFHVANLLKKFRVKRRGELASAAEMHFKTLRPA